MHSSLSVFLASYPLIPSVDSRTDINGEKAHVGRRMRTYTLLLASRFS